MIFFMTLTPVVRVSLSRFCSRYCTCSLDARSYREPLRVDARGGQSGSTQIARDALHPGLRPADVCVVLLEIGREVADELGTSPLRVRPGQPCRSAIRTRSIEPCEA